ncbi:MAG: aminoacetone oxidase family FAD-binding enzyme [Lentisphaerae bacterium]|nr:aminoacetone oxidase family FAD-binding enzyme [Lentisphaerota bacterium]
MGRGTERVIVIGSGPAGLMAALTAASSGKKVILLEALPSVGRKLLASGAGKCNFTNMLDAEAMAERFAPEQRRFVRPALLNFTPQMTREFFAVHGVKHTLVDEFYCFPASGKAGDILQVLLDAAIGNGAKIICQTQVEDLLIKDGRIAGVVAGGQTFECDYLIAAGGGPGFPLLGGRGSLDKVMLQAGVSMIKRTPALCGIKSQDEYLSELAGIVLDEVIVSLDKNNTSGGTLLFTGDGISGPAALDIAGRVAVKLAAGESLTLHINFAPDMSRAAWQQLLDDARQNNGKRLLYNSLGNKLPQALIAAITAASGVSDCRVSQLSRSAGETLLNNLTGYKLKVSSVENWDKAMASTGGVCRSRINARTMQSREIENLYFAGEFMDVDGPCGGYNIQWALSSGFTAGHLKK